MKKKLYYREYFVNHKIQKLYNFYVHQTKFERALDYLIVFAIIFTIVSMFLELFENLSEKIIHFIHLFSIIVLFIFLLELFIEYSKSKSKMDFIKKYWIDLILVSFLSFYFLFVTYLSFLRFEKILRLKNIFQDLKHYKILVKSLKNIFYKLFKN